jgi:hypothetical protein
MNGESLTDAENAPPRAPSDDDLNALIDEAIQYVGEDLETFEARLVQDMMRTSTRFLTDKIDTGYLKLCTKALKELRYAFKVFSSYEDIRKVSIFGSARTQEDHPDFETAVDFSRKLAQLGWMVITGAGGGIMRAGHLGPGRDASFGVAIRLPFETTANEVIAGDEKLIRFKYFFTRKLMFISQSHAVVLFPGGFGTQDEGFEALTLVQTGKGAMVPIVMLEAPGGDYWQHWDNYLQRSLLGYGMISPEDLNLYHLATDVDDAIDHINRFYRVYHSARYVREDLVLRLTQHLTEEQVELLNERYGCLVDSGKIVQRQAFDEEKDFLDLPRLAFHHKKGGYGHLRAMIDDINSFADQDQPD